MPKQGKGLAFFLVELLWRNQKRTVVNKEKKKNIIIIIIIIKKSE